MFVFVAMFIFTLFAFGCLGLVIVYFDCPKLLENGLDFKLLLAWYQNSDKNSSG